MNDIDREAAIVTAGHRLEAAMREAEALGGDYFSARAMADMARSQMALLIAGRSVEQVERMECAMGLAA